VVCGGSGTITIGLGRRDRLRVGKMAKGVGGGMKGFGFGVLYFVLN